MSDFDRWGKGYELVIDTETGEWKRVVDGHGNPVPPEEWDAFREYHTARQRAAAESAGWP
jgi:hypothetical protein